METPLSILKEFWNYPQFRPLQEEIIESVLQGDDTLALLPTGGGKSICFQVPALLKEGICIVITPLIALMKDQVEQLKSRSIQAVCIHAGMSKTQVDIMLDNCIYGDVKFLYVSPERLQTEIFIERVKKMNVSFIAVDEAHCISEWGHDFRPAYLKIASLRELKPEVSVLALTATATKQIRADIIEHLGFRPTYKFFQQSFARKNLSFVVRLTERKEKVMMEILRKVRGSSIVYVRSRKATQDMSDWLTKHGVSASAYHGGLDMEQRSNRQDNWISNKVRVMVATNAFGMGIDKPDVRTVIHLDLPENIEAYYQEAGRAGRDGVRSYAVILYTEADSLSLRHKVTQAHPTIEYLKKIYQSLANYYQLAVGSSEGESYDFDLHDFTERFNEQTADVYAALKKLEEQAVIQFNESYYAPSVLYFSFDKTRLYQFQVANASFDPILKMLLRLYGGELFSGFVKISESVIAKALHVTVEEAVKILKHLHDLQVLVYQPAKYKPQVTFILPRQAAETLPLDVRRMEERKKMVFDKMEAMITYVSTKQGCRMQRIQAYFDEVTEATCGICDTCIDQRKRQSLEHFTLLRQEVLHVVAKQNMTIEVLEERIAPRDREIFMEVVRDMVDEGLIAYDDTWNIRLVNK